MKSQIHGWVSLCQSSRENILSWWFYCHVFCNQIHNYQLLNRLWNYQFCIHWVFAKLLISFYFSHFLQIHTKTNDNIDSKCKKSNISIEFDCKLALLEYSNWLMKVMSYLRCHINVIHLKCIILRTEMDFIWLEVWEKRYNRCT